jgi:hypothetical protein
MKDNIDLIAMSVGAVSAGAKAIRKRLKLRDIIISLLTGGMISFGLFGVIVYFVPKIASNIHIVMLISFVAGNLSYVIIERLEDSVNDIYKIIIQWLKNRFKIKENEDN